MTEFSAEFSVIRQNCGKTSQKTLELIREMPLEIMVTGRQIATVMRTPGDEDALAAGFCVGHGILDKPGDLKKILWDPEKSPSSIDLLVSKKSAQKAMSLIKDRARPFLTMASDEAKAAELMCNDLNAFLGSDLKISAKTLGERARSMKNFQDIHRRTRSAHAVMIFDDSLDMLSAAEDVGRHNALDKAIGKIFLSGNFAGAVVVFLTCRINYEVVKKCANAKIPILVSISRPTSLAVHMAKKLGMTLALATNDEGLLVFSGDNRLT